MKIYTAKHNFEIHISFSIGSPKVIKGQVIPFLQKIPVWFEYMLYSTYLYYISFKCLSKNLSRIKQIQASSKLSATTLHRYT